ncbi:hypothetical protein [Azospirillum argentinense]|uniref:hypothetical protein n=1 Tax=Azospirillum argentinense TaxID=2970906 RepID=UPI0032DED4EA
MADEDILIVEGVEDFDVVSPYSANLSQIKHHSGDIRLSTKEAAVAVGNFIIAVVKNGDANIRYSYITTAKAGEEPRTALRTDKRAIHVWRRCSEVDACDIEGDLLHDLKCIPDILRRPLDRRASKTQNPSTAVVDDEGDSERHYKHEDVALDYLGEEISGFAEEDFFHRIIKKFTWDVSHPDTPVIEEAVSGILRGLASSWQVRPQCLEECRGRLILRIAEAAAGADGGRLTRSELEGQIRVFLEKVGALPSGDDQENGA